MSKSAKQVLSVLFHLVVLGCMVLLYDAGTIIAKKVGWMERADSVGESDMMDFMDREERLGTKIDPALMKSVKKSSDGYLFRTDLPFPPHLKVIATDITRFREVKMARRVADGSERMTLTARLEKVTEYEIAGKSVRYTMVKDENRRKTSKAEMMDKLKARKEAEKSGKRTAEDKDLIIGKLVGKAIQFKYKDGGWKALPTKEFRTMAWGKEEEPEVGKTLVENGLRPKPRWFGSKPLPIGHKIRLAEGSLGLVYENAAKGGLDLVFKAVEGVHGHPCAVFEVSGSIELKPETDAQGRAITGEETVESGKVWFSLLYPVVMRSELEMVVSYDTREKGKLVEQFQGKAQSHLHRDWKAVVKTPKTAEKK